MLLKIDDNLWINPDAICLIKPDNGDFLVHLNHTNGMFGFEINNETYQKLKYRLMQWFGEDL